MSFSSTSAVCITLVHFKLLYLLRPSFRAPITYSLASYGFFCDFLTV
jgi:hypothetical protein